MFKFRLRDAFVLMTVAAILAKWWADTELPRNELHTVHHLHRVHRIDELKARIREVQREIEDSKKRLAEEKGHGFRFKLPAREETRDADPAEVCVLLQCGQ